jgi:Copper transport outer membrane protein, MctB
LISWRYHVVSIVAVMLALALGVLAGTTFVGDPLVRILQRRTTNAEDRANAYLAERDRLSGYASETVTWLESGRLAGNRVVLIVQPPLDDALLKQALGSLQGAGADVVAQITVTSAIVDQSKQSDLAAIVGPAGTDPNGLPGALAAELADRLAFGPAPRGPDLLDRLKGFLDVVVGPGGDVSSIRGANTMAVVLTGGTGDPSIAPAKFLEPLVRDLASTSAIPTAAGESLDSTYGFVPQVRDDGAIPDGSIVTVDDLDRSYGGVALVLGLARLVAAPNGGGDYGVHGSSFIPAFTPAVAGSPGP